MHAHHNTASHTTASLSNRRVYKHTAEYAARVVGTLTSDSTPKGVRNALRAALENLAAETDLDRRKSLADASTVAALFACSGYRTYRLGPAYRTAFRARVRVWRVMWRYEREMKARRLGRVAEASRRASRRSSRPRGAARPVPSVRHVASCA